MAWKIPLFKSWPSDRDVEEVSGVIERGTYWAEGPEIKDFEKDIADYIGVKSALSFNSGTSALFSVLQSLGIEGKEVIVPSFTFVANVSPVVLARGIPVFADSEADTFGLNVEDVKRKITEKTVAIVAFHYGGIPSRDIEKIRDLAEEKGLILIEDAAESMGASINGKMVGSFGSAAMFSLCQNKIISSGEGGLLVTSSQELYEKSKLLRSHGRLEHKEDYFSTTKDNDYVSFGFNFRMPAMSAALGRSQFKKINDAISRRRNIAETYDRELSKIEGLIVPKRLGGHFQTYQMYTIRLKNKEVRDGLQEHLKENEIASKIYFNPVHLKTAFLDKYPVSSEGLPVAEELSETVLNIPLYPGMSVDDVNLVIDTIKSYFIGGDEKIMSDQMSRTKNFEESLVCESDSIRAVMAKIDRTGFKMAFVVDDNRKLLGVVSDGDIRRFLLEGGSIEKGVTEIFNQSFYCVKDKNDIDYSIIKAKGINVLPLVNKEGIIIDVLIFSYKSKDFVSYLNSFVEERAVKRVLVVGGAGYLGSVLCRKLLKKGYSVRVLDSLLFGDGPIKDLCDDPNFELVVGDMRSISTMVDAISGVDAVVHLAAIVGDPASALDPRQTIEVNYLATKLIAEICKYNQVNKFIFASTCSVYGAQVSDDEGLLTEESLLNPVSLYAEMKIMSEKALREISDENFSPTILRMGTLYGISPRMRFDLVVNILTAKAKVDGEFNIMGGEQWRPFVEVGDAADAYIKCIEAPFADVGGEIFNLGSDAQNFRIKEIGNMVHKVVPESKINVNEADVDQRDYRVSFKKIFNTLNYSPKKTVEQSVAEMGETIDSGKVKDYGSKIYSNFNYLKDKVA